MNTQNRRVWDFAGDGYVHRLILNATEGGGGGDDQHLPADQRGFVAGGLKVVEAHPLNLRSLSGVDSHLHDRREPPLSAEQEESVVHRKLEAAAYHYNQLLSWQMQQNRHLFEMQLQRIRGSSTSGALAAQGVCGAHDWRNHMLDSLRQEKVRVARQLEVAQERLQRTTRERDVHCELGRNLLRNQGEWRVRLVTAQDRLRAAEDSFM
jgi:hypothetical protein